MRSVERKEIKKLHELIRTKNYAKIKRIIIKISSIEPTLFTPAFMEEMEKYNKVLMTILKNDMNFFLVNKIHVKVEILDLISMMDHEFQKKIHEMIATSIIQDYIDSYQNQVTKKVIFFSSSFVSRSIKFHEDSLNNMKLVYSHLPREMNLQGEFTYRFFFEFKRKLVNLLYDNKFADNEIANSMKLIVNFETKCMKIPFTNNCCKKTEKKVIFDKEKIKINEEENPIKILFEKKQNLIEFEADSIHDSSFNYELIGSYNIKTPFIGSNTVEATDEYTFTAQCDHRKMLSKLFIPYLNVYIDVLIGDFKISDSIMVKEEFRIYESCIDFFTQISEMLIKILYFNEDQSLIYFMKQMNKLVLKLIDCQPKSNSFFESCVNLNSLIYIENSYDEISERIRKRTNFSVSQVKLNQKISSVETLESKRIDTYIRENLFRGKFEENTRFAVTIFRFISDKVFNIGLSEINSEILQFIIENIRSCLFSNLLNIKYEKNIALYFLEELNELEFMLNELSHDISFSGIIENFLKIFTVSPIDHTSFVDNFQKKSHKLFSFSQILRMLKDDSQNGQLYMEFKKLEKSETNISSLLEMQVK